MADSEQALALAPRPSALGVWGGAPRRDLPRHELAALLPPQRAGDPLGLGLAPGARPAAPADPDAYDAAREAREGARSLLPAEELRAVAAAPPLTIGEVRALVLANSAKEDAERPPGESSLDAELVLLIDARTDYKVFVAGDNVYTREELYATFAFHELEVQPEAVFSQQEVHIFAPPAGAPDAEPECLVRAAGDESLDLCAIADLVGRAARPGARPAARAPARVVRTKVYAGGEPWADFLEVQRAARGLARIAAAQSAGAGAPRLLALCGPGARRAEGSFLQKLQPAPALPARRGAAPPARGGAAADEAASVPAGEAASVPADEAAPFGSEPRRGAPEREALEARVAALEARLAALAREAAGASGAALALAARIAALEASSLSS